MLTKYSSLHSWDERRNLIVPGNLATTLSFCVEHFITIAKESIEDHGAFYVALSGGSTPKAIFERLASAPYAHRVNWKEVYLFWSDERSVPPDSPDSNYKMAVDAGFKNLPIPSAHIHRMQAESNIEEHAIEYEALIKKVLGNRPFDLIMLGLGEDGHTASLFPDTEGLACTDRLVIANFVPEKNTWRMTLTFPCINAAIHSVVYVMGHSKKQILARVLSPLEDANELPAARLGTKEHKALFIADTSAAP